MGLPILEDYSQNFWLAPEHPWLLVEELERGFEHRRKLMVLPRALCFCVQWLKWFANVVQLEDSNPCFAVPEFPLY